MNKYQVDIPEGAVGNWKVERFTIERPCLHETLSMLKYGRGVPPGTYTMLKRGGTVVMSDTPDEIRDHLKFIWKAHGRCLIHGLGLGMALRAILAKDTVTQVDIVEQSPEVIALVGPSYQSDPRVNIHQGDAFTFKFQPHTRWDCAWHDIWDDLCTDNLAEMSKLHTRYGRRTSWQDSWGRSLLLSRRRQEQRQYPYYR